MYFIYIYLNLKKMLFINVKIIIQKLINYIKLNILDTLDMFNHQ